MKRVFGAVIAAYALALAAPAAAQLLPDLPLVWRSLTPDLHRCGYRRSRISPDDTMAACEDRARQFARAALRARLGDIEAQRELARRYQPGPAAPAGLEYAGCVWWMVVVDAHAAPAAEADRQALAGACDGLTIDDRQLARSLARQLHRELTAMPPRPAAPADDAREAAAFLVPCAQPDPGFRRDCEWIRTRFAEAWARAKAGDFDAMRQVALMLADGGPVRRAPAEALAWRAVMLMLGPEIEAPRERGVVSDAHAAAPAAVRSAALARSLALLREITERRDGPVQAAPLLPPPPAPAPPKPGGMVTKATPLRPDF
jgi:TPR repeat protein